MSNPNEVMERNIRRRAFELWQQAGCPDGRSDEFWHRARMIETQTHDATTSGVGTEAAGDDMPPTGDTQNFA